MLSILNIFNLTLSTRDQHFGFLVFYIWRIKMALTSVNVDKEMTAAIEELKLAFGVTTNAAVLKRAVALARLSLKNADEDSNIVMLRPDGREIVVPLRF
jgi:hypothetical protein